MLRAITLSVVLFLGCVVATAQDLEGALERTRQLVEAHRYRDVVDLLTPFDDLAEPEARYAVAAELGRAYFHLGDYPAADREFRLAVTIRPQRVETALYLQATSFLLGDLDQAYAIFRELVASGATDLYPAISLCGERAFLGDPEVWRILDELATPVEVDLDAGSALGVSLGQTRPEVERRLGLRPESYGETLTARAGPYLTWAFGFDPTGALNRMMLYNEHLVRYTPYRIHVSDDLDWRATPEAATSALGAPASTAATDDGIVVMGWDRDALRITLEFAPPLSPAPPEIDADQPILRVVTVERIEPEPNPRPKPEPNPDP